MYVKQSPAMSGSNVPTLTDILAPPKGWQTPAHGASVTPVMTQDDTEAGQRLHAIRTQRGWSRAELAFRARVSEKTIERIENGKVEGRRGTIRSVAEALQVDEYAILGEPPTPLGVPLSGLVDDVRTEFRGRVKETHETLANLSQRLDAADRQRAEMRTTIIGLAAKMDQLVAQLEHVDVVIERRAKPAETPETSPEKLRDHRRTAPTRQPSAQDQDTTRGQSRDRRRHAS